MILEFKQFVESIQSEHTGEKVIIFPGRFQPFHNGHLKAFEKAYKMFKLRVIPIQIVSKNKNSPIKDKKLLQDMGNALAKENKKFIADILVKPDNVMGNIPQMIKWLRSIGYNPMGMGTGEDRYKGYKGQIDYLLSDKSDVPTEEFELKVVDDRTSGASGTAVRHAFQDDDADALKAMIPEVLFFKFYNKIKKAIQ